MVRFQKRLTDSRLADSQSENKLFSKLTENFKKQEFMFKISKEI